MLRSLVSPLRMAFGIKPRKPSYVLSFIGDDDPLRGDSHACKGIGRAFAARTNREWVYLDDAEVRKIYPQAESAAEGYDLYLAEHGYPDAVFCADASYNPFATKKNFAVHDYNEQMSRTGRQDSSLVSHHLTREILDEEGETFRKKFKNLHRPLIAVMHISTQGQSGKIAGKLIDTIRLSEFGTATIFLCGTRRTSPSVQKFFLETLRSEIAGQGLQDSVDLRNFTLADGFDRKPRYNPYLGLLANADHILIFGSSYSLVSEALFAGKTVITYGENYIDLEARNLSHRFNSFEPANGFPTRDVDAVDVTGRAVEKYVRWFKARGGIIPPAIHAPLQLESI